MLWTALGPWLRRARRLPSGFFEQIDRLGLNLVRSARKEGALQGLPTVSEIYRLLSEINPGEYTSRFIKSLRSLELRQKKLYTRHLNLLSGLQMHTAAEPNRTRALYPTSPNRSHI